MENDNILTPSIGEYHTKTTVINPNKSGSDTDSIILDVVEGLMDVRKNNQIITSLHLEYTFIDDPNFTSVTYIPDGMKDPNVSE